VEMGEKRHATDFALWKFSPSDRQRQMEWASPWGRGFPGWHIECSAMSAKYLGTFFDIHCGGEDHISVHHPNEIAQTQACYGTRLANFWLHGYFLNMEEAKMSKSTGGFVRLQTLIDRGYDPMVYRFFCLSAHYRARLNLTWRGLDGAATAWHRLRTQVQTLGEPGVIDEDYVARFANEINADLNLPRAVAVLWDLLKADRPNATKKATLLQFDRVLGLGLAEERSVGDAIPKEIVEWMQRRQQARSAKQWQLADELREQIAAAGYEIEDTPQGPHVQRAGAGELSGCS
jgi:cysteinyl-tRNA synthetase